MLTQPLPWSGCSLIWKILVYNFPSLWCSQIVNEQTGIDDPITIGSSSSKGPEPSPEQVAMLGDMGFSPAQARKALRETVRSRLPIVRAPLIGWSKGGDTERAVEWVFNHPDDTGEDVPMGDVSEATTSRTEDLSGTKTLPAKYRLKAFISHKGPSVHSGHYVAHIKHPGLVPKSPVRDGEPEEGWVLFNDEKVVKADKESVRDLKRLAYLYIFEKV